MADLIDRQAAIDALRTCQTYLFSALDDDKKISLESAEYEIEQLPSAQPDAVLVVHGKWIHDGYDFPHGVDWMHCSNCGKRDVYCPAARTNYCPNCGARMDGYETES